MPSTQKYEFNSILEESHNKLWGAHFRVPPSVADKLIKGRSRRVIASLNDVVRYQCALLSHGNGIFVISVNKKLRDLLRVSFGEKIHVGLTKDRSKYGLPMSDEMRELLRQDRIGNRLFHSLTAGRQRTLLYIAGQAKNPNARALRAVTILEHLKANEGKVNYRQLNKLLQRR